MNAATTAPTHPISAADHVCTNENCDPHDCEDHSCEVCHVHGYLGICYDLDCRPCHPDLYRRPDANVESR